VFLEAEEVGCETFAHCKKSFFLVNLKVRVICFCFLFILFIYYFLILFVYIPVIYTLIYYFFYDLFSNWL